MHKKKAGGFENQTNNPVVHKDINHNYNHEDKSIKTTRSVFLLLSLFVCFLKFDICLSPL